MQVLSRYSFLVLFLLALPMSACDNADPDPEPDPTPSIGGTYAGSYFDADIGQSVSYEFVIPNTTSGGFTLTGDASVGEGGTSVVFDLSGTGTYDHPTIAMTVTFDDAPDDPESVSGTVSSSGDILTLTNSSGESLSLTRQ